jgi:hypothetical protein
VLYAVVLYPILVLALHRLARAPAAVHTCANLDVSVHAVEPAAAIRHLATGTPLVVPVAKAAAVEAAVHDSEQVHESPAPHQPARQGGLRAWTMTACLRRRIGEAASACGGWRLAAALCVASMSYCFCFTVSHIAGAFSCTALSLPGRLPGEASLRVSLWAPDVTLSCGRGGQLAAATGAIVLGVPLVCLYLWSLLVLSWPPVPVETTAATKTSTALPHGRMRAADTKHTLPPAQQRMRPGIGGSAAAAAARMLQPAITACQAHAKAAGVSGESCAGLGVWNVDWRWWWLPTRELIKVAIVVAAASTELRGPEAQARLILLFVVAAAAITWRTKPGCSTTMERLLFSSWCWLQALALFALLPSLPGVNAAALGGALLALVVLVMLQAGVMSVLLSWRVLESWTLLSNAAAGMLDVSSGSTVLLPRLKSVVETECNSACSEEGDDGVDEEEDLADQRQYLSRN